MKLRQISQANPVTNIVLDEFEREAPILRDLEFYAKGGNVDLVKRGREPGDGPDDSIFRDLNEEQVSVAPTRAYDTVTKKIVGFEAKVDRVLEQRNMDAAAELEQETRLKANTAAQTFHEKVFLGDSAVNPKEFDGFAALVDATMIVNGNGGAPLALELGGDSKRLGQQVVIEFILNWFMTVRATHAYFPDRFLNRLVIVAKALGYYTQTVSKDALGATVIDDVVAGVIVRSAGRKYSGAEILPFTETLGAAVDTASAFAVRYGEGMDVTALTTVGISGEYEGLRGKMYVNTVDFDMQLHRTKVRSLGRLRGLQLPAAP